jgi:hypothetical protein
MIFAVFLVLFGLYGRFKFKSFMTSRVKAVVCYSMFMAVLLKYMVIFDPALHELTELIKAKLTII